MKTAVSYQFNPVKRGSKSIKLDVEFSTREFQRDMG